MKNILVAFGALLAASTAAKAADAIVYEEAPVAVVENAYNWSGVYVGVIGGGSFGDMRHDFDYLGTDGSLKTSASGAFVGGQVGYDWQFDKFVVGAVADIAWSNHKSRVDLNLFPGTPFEENLEAKSQLDYLGTVRARLGYAAFDRGLIYAHGGWAYGRVKTSISDGFDTISEKNNKNGYTVGAGVEYAFTQNMSFQTEYAYTDLGRDSVYNFNGDAINNDTKFHSIKAALNWRF